MGVFDKFIADLADRAAVNGVGVYRIRLLEDGARHNAGMDAEQVRKLAEKILPKGALKKLAAEKLLVVSVEDWEHLGGAAALARISRDELEDEARRKTEAREPVTSPS